MPDKGMKCDLSLKVRSPAQGKARRIPQKTTCESLKKSLIERSYSAGESTVNKVQGKEAARVAGHKANNERKYIVISSTRLSFVRNISSTKKTLDARGARMRAKAYA